MLQRHTQYYKDLPSTTNTQYYKDIPSTTNKYRLLQRHRIPSTTKTYPVLERLTQYYKLYPVLQIHKQAFQSKTNCPLVNRWGEGRGSPSEQVWKRSESLMWPPTVDRHTHHLPANITSYVIEFVRSIMCRQLNRLPTHFWIRSPLPYPP